MTPTEKRLSRIAESLGLSHADLGVAEWEPCLCVQRTTSGGYAYTNGTTFGSILGSTAKEAEETLRRIARERTFEARS